MPKEKENRDYWLHVRLTRLERDQLRKLAKERKQSMSKLVRQILETAIT